MPFVTFRCFRVFRGVKFVTKPGGEYNDPGQENLSGWATVKTATTRRRLGKQHPAYFCG
jgi:hypothetical protein